MVLRSLPDHTVAYNRISNRQFVKFAVESDRDGAVMHIPEAGVDFGEGQLLETLIRQGGWGEHQKNSHKNKRMLPEKHSYLLTELPC